MLRKTFPKGLLFLSVLMTISCAEAATELSPARVLGMTYPVEARGARIEGDVKATCSIRSDGSVTDVTIISGHRVLARSVISNLYRWTFRRSDNESGAAGQVIVRYSFHLKGDCVRSTNCKEEYWYEFPDHITVVS